MIIGFIKSVKKATYLDIGTDAKILDQLGNIDDESIMVMGFTFLSERIYNPSFNHKTTQMYIRIDKIGKDMHTVSLTLSIPPRENSNVFDINLLERYMKIKNLLNG